MEQDQKFQEVNITDLWHRNLYASLSTLQDLEKNCRDGAQRLVDFLNIPVEKMPEIQFQNLKMMVTEMGILLANSRKKIDRKFYINSTIALKSIKEKIDLHPEAIHISFVDQSTKTVAFKLSPEYYIILNKMTLMRENIVSELADVLFGKASELPDGLDKSKPLRD